MCCCWRTLSWWACPALPRCRWAGARRLPPRALGGGAFAPGVEPWAWPDGPSRRWQVAATCVPRQQAVDEAPLSLAALLHDCPREYSNRELLAGCEEWGVPVRDVDRRSPVLLHGMLAVEIARRELSLTDPAMANAVRWHTAGHPEMTLSDKLFYLADVTETNNHFDWVVSLRDLAREDVDNAVLMAVGFNVEHLDRHGRTSGPGT